MFSRHWLRKAIELLMKNRAFALMELLVVVGIIGTLTAILCTAFATVRERSLLRTCIANNEQIGTAFRIYIQDTDEVLPHWCDVYNKTWDTYIAPIVKTNKVFTCPADTSSVVRLFAATDRPVRSYSLPRNVGGMPLSRMKAPSRTVLLYEKGRQRMGIAADSSGEWFGQSISGTTDVRFQQADPDKWPMPHGNGKVFLYVDGHAQWHKAILAESTDNPFGYAFGPFPSSLSGSYRPGYCGDIDSTAITSPSTLARYGANLPR